MSHNETSRLEENRRPTAKKRGEVQEQISNNTWLSIYSTIKQNKKEENVQRQAISKVDVQMNNYE